MIALEQGLFALVEQSDFEAKVSALPLLEDVLQHESRFDRVANNGWLQIATTLLHHDQAVQPVTRRRGTESIHSGEQEAEGDRTHEPGLLCIDGIVCIRSHTHHIAGNKARSPPEQRPNT